MLGGVEVRVHVLPKQLFLCGPCFVHIGIVMLKQEIQTIDTKVEGELGELAQLKSRPNPVGNGPVENLNEPNVHRFFLKRKDQIQKDPKTVNEPIYHLSKQLITTCIYSLC